MVAERVHPRRIVMSEQEMTHKDQEEAVPAFSEELSDEALDRREGAFPDGARFSNDICLQR
jgi:hypothetical protein